MIENIRKYTGLMIVVFVLLFVSFLLLDTSTVQSVGGGGAVIRVDGRSYNEKEFRRIGTNGYELAQQMLRLGDFSVYQFLIAATAEATGNNDEAEKFFATRILLRKAADDYGIHPPAEEISTRIRSMRMFAGPDGDFDARTYGTFIERGIGRLGMTESDVREFVADLIIFDKLGEIVGAGLTPARDTLARNLAFQNQQISGALARIDLTPFELDVDPTDDEVLEFWENLRDAFVTEPRRRFTYVIASPDFPPGTEDPEDDDEPAESLADAFLSDAQRAERAAEREAERAAKAADRADLRRKAQLASDSTVDDFLFRLEQEKGATFEGLAEEMGLEVRTSEFFPLSGPPADLAVTIRQSSRGGTAADELFRMITTADPFSKISPAIPIGETDWIVARLDEIEPSRPKEFAEASAEARALLIEENAVAAMTAAAREAHEKIAAAIAEGTPFAEAAQAAGIEEIHSFDAITGMHQPDPANEPRELFEQARTVTPGTLADVVIEADRAFILHVAKREIIRDENADRSLDMEVANITRANQTTAVAAWLRDRTRSAAVQPLWR